MGILKGSRVSNLPELHVLRGDLLRALAAGEAEAPRMPSRGTGRRSRGPLSSGPGRSCFARRPGWPAFASRPATPLEPSAVLRPIFAQFTEGFDTADLRDARELLEEVEGLGAG